nr:Gag-Pol polyprotein [Tanacetum cinerariifolium]
MTIEPHNWSSSAHQELHKIVKDETFPIVNQVDARVQNFEIQFLKEAAKFVRDFKSLANEADASLAKHKALELEIERLLKVVVSQDIMIILQKESIVDTSDLQTELKRTKERFENCIIKKENKYAKLWNDWYKKCDECKYDKISENAYLKATYKNLFDSISVSRAQTKTIIASLQNELQSTIYKNAKLRTQLFKKVSDQKDNTHDTSDNTKFAKQPIVENLPKVGESHALSKPVTSNFVSTPQETKDNTKTRRRQPRSNTKHDRVPSASKSSRSKNKEVEEHHRNLLLSKNTKHMSSACNNIKLDSQDVISKVVYAMCYLDLFVVRRLGLFQAHDRKPKASHQLRLEVYGNCLPKFKYNKEHICPSCEQGKSKRASHPPKPVPNSRQRLHLFHMDFCGPTRIASINRKRYVLVIVDDYSRYTWVHFLRSKDEAPEAIATACFTQNRFIVHRRFNKTPYKLINERKSDISFLHVFGALCYPKNDCEDIGKLGAKGLDLTYAPSTITTQQPTEGELDLLFEAMYDDYIGDTAPTPTNSSSHATNIPTTSQDVDELNSNAMVDGNTFVNLFSNSSTSAAESSSS